MTRTLREPIEDLLRISPVSLNCALGLLFSAGIATIGLVLNSSAVVIGAMLISPLIGPILAAGLALAASDLYLGIKSLLSISAGVSVAVLFSRNSSACGAAPFWSNAGCQGSGRM